MELDHLNDELRKKYPAAARAADHERSRAEMIRLNCLACAQGRENVRACPSLRCFFWPLRPYRDDRERPPGLVPTAEEYTAMVEESSRPGATEFLAQARAAKKAKAERGDDGAPEEE